MDVIALTKGIFYFWVYVDGTLDEAEKFECTLKLTDKDGNKLCFTKKAVSVDKDRDNVMREATDCFMLPAALVKNQFWNSDEERLRGEIRVKKAAPPTPPPPTPAPAEANATEQTRLARKRPAETRARPKSKMAKRTAGGTGPARNSR